MSSPMSPDEAANVLLLVQSDAEAHSAVRQSYAGRHDVDDALWWRAHPLSVSPRGTADPASERATLQAGAFSRAGSPDSAARLAELEERLAADDAALEKAMVDARPALDAATARAARRASRAAVADGALPLVGRAAGNSVASGAAADASAPRNAHELGAADDPDLATDLDDSAAAESTVARWRRRSQLWMYTAIVCGVLLLAGVGLVVVQQLAPQATPGFALLPAAAGTGIPTPSQTLSGTTRGLTIFSDPSLAPSIPPENIDPYYQPESLRLLGVANSFLTVYAVENRINQPCLLAVYTDGTQSATCVTTEEFMSMGIELRITSLQLNNGSDSFPDRSVSQDVVFWNPDGSYGVSSSARTPAAG